ncbi:hypothetical protein HWV62_33395 [Athelia sp. TMB]|nr:hypothetical protein HWV62_33395 [Athelia sp. TMB]
MTSPSSPTFLRTASFSGSSSSRPWPPASHTTFDQGDPRASGSYRPPDELEFDPYADVHRQDSNIPLVDRSSYPTSMSSTSIMAGGNQVDVYRERPKSTLAKTTAVDDSPAPPPYTPSHQHSYPSQSAGFISNAPSIGMAVPFLDEPRLSDLQLEWSGAERDGETHPPPDVDNTPSEEFGVASKRRPLHRRAIFQLLLLALAIVVIAVIIPIYFLVVKRRGPTPITGGDGSTIYVDGEPSFVYSNPFGGTCEFWIVAFLSRQVAYESSGGYYDPEDPFNNNAQANNWTPPLNTPWNISKNRINGVNLIGLFVMQPLTTPDIFQRYPGSVDEWTLSTMMTANGSLQSQMEDHYSTFITEQDIAEIAGYILRVLQWARKYGLRVNLDLNAIPGSQNGLSHSGKVGSINFLNGVMGIANAQRTLDYIRIITEFISQPEWTNVVPMFSVLNEPEQLDQIGNAAMYSFYLKVHDMIRGITGVGQGPFIAISDSSHKSPSTLSMLHLYFTLRRDSNPHFTSLFYYTFNTPAPLPYPECPCTKWAANMNISKATFGFTFAAEITASFNDCGLFARGSGPNDTTQETSNCDLWSDHTQWNQSVISSVLNFALSSTDAAQDYFFSTWKVGNSTAGKVEAPLWSYQLGLEYGWIPKDPRQSLLQCAQLAAFGSPFDGQYQPWQTGGSGAGVIAPTFISQYGQWPPTITGGFSAAEAASLLPMYTSTGTVATLPPPTLTASASRSISVGDGWADRSDTAAGVTVIAGCAYPNAWSAVSVSVPTACPGDAVVAAVPPALR